MKKDNGLCPIVLSTPKSKVYLATRKLQSRLTRVLTVIFMTLAAMFMFTSITLAQTASSPDLKTKFKDNKKEMRQEKRELREEKESTKAVENIPQAIMNKFHANFPNAKNVAWSVPEGYVEADYTIGKHQRMAFYSYDDNNLMGTGRFLPYANLPAKGRERIAKDYPGYTPVKAMFYDDNEDNSTNMLLYGIPITKDAYFAQLKKGDKQIVIQVDRDGEISYFGDVK